jgi:hypothetical protein
LAAVNDHDVNSISTATITATPKMKPAVSISDIFRITHRLCIDARSTAITTHRNPLRSPSVELASVPRTVRRLAIVAALSRRNQSTNMRRSPGDSQRHANSSRQRHNCTRAIASASFCTGAGTGLSSRRACCQSLNIRKNCARSLRVSF